MILFAVGVAIGVIIGYFIPGPNDSCKQVVPQETVQQQGQGKGQTTTSSPGPGHEKEGEIEAKFCPNDQSEIKTAVSGERGIF